MRRFASFLLLGVVLTASAATEIWRWKDADGVVHYADSPVAGAERVSAAPTPRSGGAAAAQVPDIPAPAPAPDFIRYTRCDVTQPAKDEVFFSVDSVDAGVAIEPALQRGHRIQVWMNGGVVAEWPETSTNYKLTGLYRGTYTLAVKVIDGYDHTLCSGPAVNFHIRQPSTLSPARQPPKKK